MVTARTDTVGIGLSRDNLFDLARAYADRSNGCMNSSRKTSLILGTGIKSLKHSFLNLMVVNNRNTTEIVVIKHFKINLF